MKSAEKYSMRHRILGLIFSGLLVLLITSCEKTLYKDFPSGAGKLVLNGTLSQNKGLWMNVSRSISISVPLKYSYLPVRDATLLYFQEDSLIATITGNSTGDYYEREFKPQPGKKYKVTVNTAGVPEAKAEMVVPLPVDILDYEVANLSRQDPNYPIYYIHDFYVKLTFTDPDTLKNFYMLGVYYPENENLLPIDANSEDIDVNFHIRDGIHILAWSDENFNGQNKEISFNFEYNRSGSIDTRFYIYLYSIEENYFKYLKSYARNYTVLNDNSLIHECVQVFTNIEGGFGIMAATSYNYFSFGFKY